MCHFTPRITRQKRLRRDRGRRRFLVLYYYCWFGQGRALVVVCGAIGPARPRSEFYTGISRRLANELKVHLRVDKESDVVGYSRPLITNRLLKKHSITLLPGRRAFSQYHVLLVSVPAAPSLVLYYIERVLIRFGEEEEVAA